MCVCFCSGLKCTASAFFVFTLTVTLVAYTATAMTMAISADQSVVGLASIFMTITFVFMMVSLKNPPPLSLRFSCSDLRPSCEEIIPPAFADFLGSPGQPAQHQGLAGLAQVLQHSSLRPRCKPRGRKGRITDLNMAKKKKQQHCKSGN